MSAEPSLDKWAERIVSVAALLIALSVSAGMTAWTVSIVNSGDATWTEVFAGLLIALPIACVSFLAIDRKAKGGSDE